MNDDQVDQPSTPTTDDTSLSTNPLEVTQPTAGQDNTIAGAPSPSVESQDATTDSPSRSISVVDSSESTDQNTETTASSVESNAMQDSSSSVVTPATQPVTPQSEVVQSPATPSATVTPQTQSGSPSQSVQPASVGAFAGNSSAKKPKKKILGIVGIVVGLIILAGGAFALLTAKPLVGDLVSENAEGFSFLRPESWVSEEENDLTAYHPEETYRIIDNDEQYELLVLHGIERSSLGGFNASALSSEDKQKAKDAILAEYGQGDAILDAFTSEVCTSDEKNEGFKEIPVSGAFLAIQIDFSCTIEEEGQKDNVKGALQFSISSTESRLDLFGIVGIVDAYDSNIDKVNEMLSSTKYQ